MSVESRSESRFIVRLFVKLFSLVVGVVLAIVIGAFVIYLLAGFNSVMIYNPTLGRLYPIPVSYTHLDVYKRQPLHFFRGLRG